MSEIMDSNILIERDSNPYIEEFGSTTNVQVVTVVDALEFLSKFVSRTQAIEVTEYFDSKQIYEFVGLLLNTMINHKEYGTPYIQPVYYEDTEKIAFVNVVFEFCNWNDWKELELEFKAYQNSTKGMVAVTCIRGLVE